jgi:hypothetical protein
MAWYGLRGGSGVSVVFERDMVAEAFEAALQIGDGSGLPDLVEIGFAEVPVWQALGKHVICGDQYLI